MGLRRQAEVAEHVGARPLADAGELDAALTADPVLLVLEQSPDELPCAVPRHPHHRVVTVVVTGDEDGGHAERRRPGGGTRRVAAGAPLSTRLAGIAQVYQIWFGGARR